MTGGGAVSTGSPNRSLPRPLPVDDTPILNLWLGVYSFPTVSIAEEIGLFVKLSEAKQLSAEEISRLYSLTPRATEALLAILCSLGYLRCRRGLFSLTQLAKTYLLPSSPFYVGGILHLLRDIPFTHSALKEALFKDTAMAYGGRDIWEVHKMDQKQAEVFTEAMQALSAAGAAGVASRGDFRGVHRLLDVGGGSGCYCAALALRYPEIQFTVLEMPGVADITRRYLERFGVADRVAVHEANMFTDPWPPGHDAVFFSNIFHDWDEQSCRRLVKNSREALPTGGRIYIYETLLNEAKDGPLHSALYSMDMIYFTKGKQFTKSELVRLLHEGGFRGISVTKSFSYWSLISARRA